MKNNLKFPLFIDLTDKKAVVVGGGKIAVRRIKTLLLFGARVKAVAESFIEKEDNPNIEYIEKSYEEKDLEGAFIVVGATDKREINHRIYVYCKENGILHSIADKKEECDFYFPAVCTNEKLSIGITSDGSDHSLVRKTAEEIRRLIGNGEEN